jgi:hypothetical protein
MPRGLLSGPGQRGPPYSWRIRLRRMLRYQEGVMVLLQDGPARTEMQSPSSRWLYGAAASLIEGSLEKSGCLSEEGKCLLRLA